MSGGLEDHFLFPEDRDEHRRYQELTEETGVPLCVREGIQVVLDAWERATQGRNNN